MNRIGGHRTSEQILLPLCKALDLERSRIEKDDKSNTNLVLYSSDLPSLDTLFSIDELSSN